MMLKSIMGIALASIISLESLFEGYDLATTNKGDVFYI